MPQNLIIRNVVDGCATLDEMAEASDQAIPTSYSYATLHNVYQLCSQINVGTETHVGPEEFDFQGTEMLLEIDRVAKKIREDVVFHRNDAMRGWVDIIESIRFGVTQMQKQQASAAA